MTSPWLRIVILVLSLLLAGIFLYGGSLWSLIHSVLNRVQSSAGAFIPLLSGYFIWMKWPEIEKVPLKRDLAGSSLVAVGIAASFLRIGGFQIQFIAFILFAAGAIWTIFGLRLLKEVLFPLLFLITMIPMPMEWYADLAKLTREITYNAALWVSSMLGVAFFRQGYNVHFYNTVLDVALACSGVRYLDAYFIFGIAYAYLSRKTNVGRIALIACTIPISLTASIFRLTFIFLGVYYISPRLAEHRPHILISWAVFLGVLIVSLALDQRLQKRFKAESDRR